MSMSFSRIIMGFCFLLFITSSAFAQKVNVDYDRGIEFTKYKTFAFGTGTPAPNPLAHQRIMSGIEAQLIMKGLRKVESNPDIVVVYHTATDTQISVNTMGGGPFGGWRFGSGT